MNQPINDGGPAMTPEKQRRTIAEACGWTAIEDIEGFWRAVDASGYVTTDLWISESNVWSVGMPDYLNDLNAMHEAEKVLTNEQLEVYCNILHKPNHGVYWAIRATAAQRAEAFLRTTGKWEEGK